MPTYRITNNQTGKVYRITGNTPPSESDIQQIFNAGDKQPQSKVPDWAKTALPVGGAIVGGVAGGGLGTLLGIPSGPGAAATGYAGAIGGAGLGGAAGQSTVNILERLLGGTPPKTASANAQSLLSAAGSGAGSQAIGVPIAKGLGVMAHPIKPFTNRITNILKKSGKTIDLESILGQLKNEVLPKYTAKGLNAEAQAGYKNVQPDILSAAHAISPHDSSAINLNAPINLTNLLKSNLQKGANYRGGKRTMEEQLRGDFARLLKEKIAQLEPGVKTPNKIASLLYQIPNILEDLTYLSPQYGGGVFLRKIGSIPAKGIQAALPYGGGRNNALIPGLLNSLNFPQQQ